MVSADRAREMLADLKQSEAEIEDAHTLAWLFVEIGRWFQASAASSCVDREGPSHPHS
jgi:hypothetical protein